MGSMGFLVSSSRSFAPSKRSNPGPRPELRGRFFAFFPQAQKATPNRPAVFRTGEKAAVYIAVWG